MWGSRTETGQKEGLAGKETWRGGGREARGPGKSRAGSCGTGGTETEECGKRGTGSQGCRARAGEHSGGAEGESEWQRWGCEEGLWIWKQKKGAGAGRSEREQPARQRKQRMDRRESGLGWRGGAVNTAGSPCRQSHSGQWQQLRCRQALPLKPGCLAKGVGFLLLVRSPLKGWGGPRCLLALGLGCYLPGCIPRRREPLPHRCLAWNRRLPFGPAASAWGRSSSSPCPHRPFLIKPWSCLPGGLFLRLSRLPW